MVKISVVLILQNNEDTVARTLESIIGQEFKDFEIIVVDINSNDETYQTVNKFSYEFNFIRHYKITNSTPGGAKNYAYNKADGKFIVFLEGGCILKSDFLYKMYQKAQMLKANVVCCNYGVYQNDPRNITKTYSRFVYPSDITADKLFDKELIEKYKLAFSGLNKFYDLSFVHFALLNTVKTAYIDECLINCQNKDNDNINDVRDLFLALIELKEKLISQNKFLIFKSDFQNIALKSIFSYFYFCKDIKVLNKMFELIKYYENEFDILRTKNVKFKRSFELYCEIINEKNFFNFFAKYKLKKILNKNFDF